MCFQVTGNSNEEIKNDKQSFQSKSNDNWSIGLPILTRYAQNVEDVKQMLKDFAKIKEDQAEVIREKKFVRKYVEREKFPAPGLILFLLHGLCGFPSGYRGEKTHWFIPFRFKDIMCGIALEKFGLYLYSERCNKAFLDSMEVLEKLEKAIKAMERKILQNIAIDQVNKGNITIKNMFPRLSDQYFYFRQKASQAFSAINKSTRPLEEDYGSIAEAISDWREKTTKYSAYKETKQSEEGCILDRKLISTGKPAEREGSYNALAMIDAYFSRLEHFLVLALPFGFIPFDRESENISCFVKKYWSEKMKRVLNIENPKVKKFYDQLVSVKEKYRNTFAHGGFEKKGASFYFHLDGFGAIPAMMSGHKNSVHFIFSPLDVDSFKNVCAIFDEFDHWLKEQGLPFAWKYAESGLNLSFNKEDVSEMLASADTPESFDKWLDHLRYLEEIYTNADY